MNEATPSPGDETMRAARAVLSGDGRGFVLQPWQVAWLIDTSEGRQAVVPPGCGVGKGWLDARIREALEALPERTEST